MIFSDPISSFFYVLNFALNTVSGVMVTSWAKNIVTFLAAKQQLYNLESWLIDWLTDW